MREVLSYRVELNGGITGPVPVVHANYASFQIVPIDYGTTTGVIEIKASLTADTADAQSFGSAVTPNMTNKAITPDVDVRGVAYLFIHNTTADGTKAAHVHVYVTDRE